MSKSIQSVYIVHGAAHTKKIKTFGYQHELILSEYRRKFYGFLWILGKQRRKSFCQELVKIRKWYF